jgi:hypothetical protein
MPRADSVAISRVASRARNVPDIAVGIPHAHGPIS